MSTRDLVFGSPELEVRLRPACEEVLKHFDVHDTRLVCFFDDRDTPAMTEQIGPLYCGLFSNIKGNTLPFPDYLLPVFIDYEIVPSRRRYDEFIYVRNTTCETVPGTVITLAHELTHYRQRHTAAKVWWANTILYNSLWRLDRERHSRSNAWDIPIEHEAQLNSRRVAFEVLGEAMTDAHAAGRIEAEHDPKKWQFFQSLSTSATYDLLEATKPWVEQYRTGLQRIPQDIEPEIKIDFTQPEWWR
jgi:hypothetical protein